MTDAYSADAPTAAPEPSSVGATLRESREAAGLSIDAVAQQLKLAPRQVKALEDDEHDLLPGRTFVRGFVRNYARLLHLDPDAVVAGLPVAAPTAALPPTPPAIGEIVGARSSRWSRWVIPLALIVLVAVAALYEYLRPGDASRNRSQPAASAPAPASVPAAPDAAPAGPGGSPLPNPLAPQTDGPRSALEPVPSLAAGSTAPAVPNPVAGNVPAPAPVAAATPIPASAGTNPAPANGAPGAGAGSPLALDFHGPSWVEVRDRSGRIVLSITGAPGTRQTVSAEAPLDVIIGNAAGVGVTYKGAPVDVASQQRQNVARLKLD